MTTLSNIALDFRFVRRVRIRLRAGVLGFETEPVTDGSDLVAVPAHEVSQLKAAPAALIALQVRDQGMEPMLFEDDWIVIDTNDTARRSGEVYAVNWNGEACIQQLVERGGQWYLNYVNPSFKPINVRSGKMSIVGRAVYQPGRIIIGRL